MIVLPVEGVRVRIRVVLAVREFPVRRVAVGSREPALIRQVASDTSGRPLRSLVKTPHNMKLSRFNLQQNYVSTFWPGLRPLHHLIIPENNGFIIAISFTDYIIISFSICFIYKCTIIPLLKIYTAKFDLYHMMVFTVRCFYFLLQIRNLRYCGLIHNINADNLLDSFSTSIRKAIKRFMLLIAKYGWFGPIIRHYFLL